MAACDASTLTIPELSLPFPDFAHPAIQEIDEASVQWLLDFGLVRDAKQEQYIRAIGLGRWFPSLLPGGETDKVLLGSQLTAWYTMLDDQVAEKHARQGDSAALLRQLVHCEDIARLPDNWSDDASEGAALHRALQDLNLRLRKVATPEQVTRLQWYSLQFYLGIACETAYTAQGIIPTVADYRRIRRLNTCMPPFFVMSEIARGYQLPLGPLLRPDVQELTALAVDLTAVINDIIGLPRDLARGDTWVLSGVLAHQQKLSVAESLDFMVDQFRRDTSRFVKLASQIRATDTDTLPRYIGVLQDLVAGHLAWTKRSARYKIGGWH